MKLTKLNQLIIGLITIALVAFLTQAVFLKGDKRSIENIRKKNTKLRSDINIAKSIKDSAEELQEEMAHLNAQLERLKKILPVTVNEPRFMADIKRYANENGIEIVQISNNRPFRDDVIVEHPFTYKARGTYHDFGAFFAQMSNYPRIINVKGLHLKREKSVQGYTVQGAFIVSVFTYQEPTKEELDEQVEAKKKERKKLRKGKGKKRRGKG